MPTTPQEARAEWRFWEKLTDDRCAFCPDYDIDVRVTMRAALMLALPCAARKIGRARRFCRAILDRAGHEAGKGNVVTATVLLGVWLAGL